MSTMNEMFQRLRGKAALSVGALLLVSGGCGKDAPGIKPAEAPESAQAAKPDERPEPAPEAGPQEAPQGEQVAEGGANKAPEDFVFAKVGGVAVHGGLIMEEIKGKEDGLTLSQLRELVQSRVFVEVLREDAGRIGMDVDGFPSAQAFLEAYRREAILKKAEHTLRDSELAAYFTRRVGMSRIVFREEADAQEVHGRIAKRISGGEGAVEAFRAEKNQGREMMVPEGIMIDESGAGEDGRRVLPRAGAEALFALKADGDYSEPLKLGQMWVILQRVSERPAQALDSLSEEALAEAKEALLGQRAEREMRDLLQRRMRDMGVRVDRRLINEFAKAQGIQIDRRLDRGRLMRDGGRGREIRRMPGGRDGVRRTRPDMGERLKRARQPRGEGPSTVGEP